MDNFTVQIPRGECEQLLTYLRRSQGYCLNARLVRFPMSDEDLHAEPTEFYSGASGYAGGTLRDVIQTLESSLD